MSDINWDDENDTTEPAPRVVDKKPKRKGSTQSLEAAIQARKKAREDGTDPACLSTYKKSGPLFGSWDAHATYLLQREAELVSELEMTRSDLAKVRRRKAEERDGQDR